jgi:hypothetical protein
MYTLHSWMSALDYTVEPEVECLDSDMSDAAFVHATTTIGGHDAVQEFFVCWMYPLASSFSFRVVTVGTNAVSKVKTPLPLFPVEPVPMKDDGRFLVKVEMDTERILGNYGTKEHKALMMVKLPNGGRLNQVFELRGVPYAPHPLPDTEASQAVTLKHKADMSKKVAAKKPKVAQSGKEASVKTNVKKSIVMVIRPKAKSGLKGTSEIELILAKPIEVSKKFCLSDVPSSF